MATGDSILLQPGSLLGRKGFQDSFMLQDLRFGLKLLAKERSFTITALLTLALCIGANTAIYTVLHAVVLDRLPFPEPDRLVAIGNIYPGAGITKASQNSVPDYMD